LRVGLEAARACGATALIRRAHEELVTAGARPRRLQFSGVESLTASERRVAKLAAGGDSNRVIAAALFITVRTVETHLSRAYRKLDIGSRAELSEALGAPGEAGETGASTRMTD
jgi:DNA-binding CsgD family transcriptional regulator